MQNLHENEIQELYTFFEQWYRGTIENSDEDFRRLEDVLAPEFTLITLSDIPLPGLETASKNLLKSDHSASLLFSSTSHLQYNCSVIVMRAFKTELDLNNQQKSACQRHAGATRYAYNLHRELIRLKKTELSWMYEVSKCAPQEALRDLDQAFKHFFRRVKEKRAGKAVKVGFPRFKSRK